MNTRMNRRMFIRSAGGAALAIPFLPSLTTRAFAQEGPAISVGRNFLAICSDHGDIWGANQYPEDGLLTQTMRYAGRDVRYGQLPTQAGMNGRVTWSAIYTADAQQLTPQLASKFNVLKGLDIPYRIGHHNGGHLGNFLNVDAAFLAGIDSKLTKPLPLIKSAYSNQVYTPDDLQQRMTHRSFHRSQAILSKFFQPGDPQWKRGASAVSRTTCLLQSSL